MLKLIAVVMGLSLSFFIHASEDNPETADKSGQLSVQYSECKANSINAMQMLDCVSEEDERQQSRLVTAEKARIRAIAKQTGRSPEDIAGLMKSRQEAWRKHIEEECSFYFSLYAGGSYRGVEELECTVKKTAARANEFEQSKEE